MKCLKTLLILIAFPAFLFAQSNYKPGYIVKLDGDTVKGLIDYREWETNPGKIFFKNNQQDQTQSCTPENTAAFGITGLDYYEGHVVSISRSSTDVNKISIKTDTDSQVYIDTVFLHVLEKGKNLTLFEYADKIKTRYYIGEAGQSAQPEELVYQVYYATDNSTVQYNERYRTQLLYEAQKANMNTDDVQRMIFRARYYNDDLSSVIRKINGNSNTQTSSSKQFGTRWFAGAGIVINNMTFTGDIQYPNNSNVSPRASFGLDLFTNKSTQKVFIRIELSVSSDQHDFKDSYQQTELKMTQFTLSITPQLYYNFYNSTNLKVFAAAGLPFNFSGYPTRYYTTLGGIYASPVKENDFPDYHKIWEAGVIKAGIVLNEKIEIYAGYSPSTTLTDNYTQFSGTLVSCEAGINYLFGAK